WFRSNTIRSRAPPCHFVVPGSFRLACFAPQTLDDAAPALVFEAAALRGQRGTGWATRAAGLRCLADQGEQALPSIFPVTLLGPKALGGDDQHPLLGQAPPGEPLEPLPYRLRQARRALDIEAQLNRGRDLIDLLTAGPAGTQEVLLNLLFLNGEAVSDGYHETAADPRRRRPSRRPSRGAPSLRPPALMGPRAASISANVGRGPGGVSSSARRMARTCSAVVPQQPPMMWAPAARARTA